MYKEKPLDLKILKQDVPIYLEGDEELIQSQHTVEYHKAMCDHAEKMCKMLNNRGFQIKNAIDWKRFMEGSMRLIISVQTNVMKHVNGLQDVVETEVLKLY